MEALGEEVVSYERGIPAGFRVKGSWLGGWGSGFGVWGLVEGLGSGVKGEEFGSWILELRV